MLFFCAGIALLGLLGGGEHRLATARNQGDPMTRYYPAGMPRYPDVRELPAGPSTRVGASKLRMSLFVTDHEPHRVGRFYARYWRARQLWVRSDITHLGGVVSAVDEHRGQVYQVLLIARGGQTTVFPSVTRAPQAANNTGTTEPPVPLCEDSKVLFSLTTRDGGTTARIVMSVNPKGLAGNLQHYRQVLAAAGYRPVKAKAGLADGRPLGASKADGTNEAAKGTDRAGELRVLVYSKGDGAEVTINLTSLGGDRVRVHMVGVDS